ncbi:MAG: HAD family phosphatase [Candidatus Omnitrophica bacterium]|nr:HAD family phosphatase [Candidatus Omnitrophota bacterium]
MEIRNTNGLKALAFDLGRVLFDFDYNIALNKIKDKMSVSGEEVIQALFYENFADDFERGLVSGYDFYSHFKEKTSLNLDYRSFVPVWCDIFTLKEDSFSLLKSLSAIYKTFLISNINELHYQFLKKRYPQVFSLFEAEILSFQVKYTKPARQIYDILISKAGVNKEELVYIDDRADLIEEANRQGLNCIQFTDVEQCKKELLSFGCRFS